MPNHVHGTGHAKKAGDPVGALEQAIEAAWKDAKDNHGGQPGPYVVERIEVECENPITAYTVIIVSQ
jgi:hypothetical protein